MLIVRQRLGGRAACDARLVLPFAERQKSRLRTAVESGEEIGLFLDRGTVLRGGDRLRADDGRVVEVVAADEELIEVRCADAQALARAAYHLGNRHTAVQVGPDWLRIAADEVLARMLTALGATLRRVHQPFEPEAGAYAAAHTHAGAAAHGGVIHDFGRRVSAGAEGEARERASPARPRAADT